MSVLTAKRSERLTSLVQSQVQNSDVLSCRQLFAFSGAAIAFFHLAYTSAAFVACIIPFLIYTFELRRTNTPRRAFYVGLLTGLAIYAPQLFFFWEIFGFPAIALWLVLAFWIALFVLLAHSCHRRMPGWGSALAIPFLWTGLEYFRSELYYLRFSWLSPGFAFVDANLLPQLAELGVYGIGFALMLAISVLALLARKSFAIAAVALTAVIALGCNLSSRTQSNDISGSKRVSIVGIQLEFPTESELLSALDKLIIQQPHADMLALSEYTLDGPVPDSLKGWCRSNQKYLIVGGKSPMPNSNFYDTAFVVGPSGEIVFEQAKAVPIQFFNDGLPAPAQKIWDSPWGKIGICVCYDLSYARVTDELIHQGAQALIVPTMDLVEWGRRQHELHARIAPMRAAEYRVPIFRLASSGISQNVDARGRVLGSASFPGQGEVLAGELVLGERGRFPLDRFLAPVAVAITGFIVLGLFVVHVRDRRRIFSNHSLGLSTNFHAV